jgi:hypothetical protein
MPRAREVSTAFCKLIGHARTQKLQTMGAKITKACTAQSTLIVAAVSDRRTLLERALSEAN